METSLREREGTLERLMSAERALSAQLAVMKRELELRFMNNKHLLAARAKGVVLELSVAPYDVILCL